jgi:hypothetical protein
VNVGDGWQASELSQARLSAVPRSAKADHRRWKEASAGLPAEAARRREEASRVGGSNSVVESQPSKLLVAGSIPVSRSNMVRGTSVPRSPFTPSLAGAPRAPLRSAGALAVLAPSRARTEGPWIRSDRLIQDVRSRTRANAVSEPRERSEPAKRRARERVGESEGQTPSAKADVAQLAERVLGKDEVTSSILVIGSNLRSRATRASYGWRAM